MCFLALLYPLDESPGYFFSIPLDKREIDAHPEV
jgi:hypothetical protein